MSESTPKLLEKVLNYTSIKQRVIGKNIANVGTLNYRREDVKFDEFLSDNLNSKLKLTNSRHIDTATNPDKMNNKIFEDSDTENVSGFNNVDINQEMAEMAQNTLLFKFAARKLNSYFRALQGVIKGGQS